MATATTYAHIARDARTCGGLPRIAGTRVRVIDIVVLHKRGLSPAEILDSFEHLSLAQVHSALAYFYDHQAEIQEQFDKARAIAENFKKQHPNLVR